MFWSLRKLTSALTLRLLKLSRGRVWCELMDCPTKLTHQIGSMLTVSSVQAPQLTPALPRCRQLPPISTALDLYVSYQRWEPTHDYRACAPRSRCSAAISALNCAICACICSLSCAPSAPSTSCSATGGVSGSSYSGEGEGGDGGRKAGVSHIAAGIAALTLGRGGIGVLGTLDGGERVGSGRMMIGSVVELRVGGGGAGLWSAWRRGRGGRGFESVRTTFSTASTVVS